MTLTVRQFRHFARARHAAAVAADQRRIGLEVDRLMRLRPARRKEARS